MIKEIRFINNTTITFSSSNTANNIFSRFDGDNGPENDLKSFNRVDRNGVIFQKNQYRNKIFRIAGTIKANTKYDLQNKIDLYKKELLSENPIYIEVDYEQSDGSIETMYGQVILNNPDFMFNREYYHLNITNFQLEINLFDGFFEKSQKSIIKSNQTDNVTITSSEIDYKGTTFTAPIIITNINTAGNINKIECKIGNTRLNIEGEFQDGGYFGLDSETQQVLGDLNGDGNRKSIDFAGFFPRLDINKDVLVSFYDVDDNFATGFDVDLGLYYKERFV